MAISRMTIMGKGAIGLLYGSIAAETLGADAVEYVMDDARFERHTHDRLKNRTEAPASSPASAQARRARPSFSSLPSRPPAWMPRSTRRPRSLAPTRASCRC